MDNLNPHSFVIAAGRDHTPGSPMNVPPIMASNFVKGGDRNYARSDGTATTAALEEIVGGLEGGRALAFGSGMAAAATVFDRLAVGAHVVIPTDAYHGVSALAAEGARQSRWTAQQVDLADTDAWLSAATTADLIWLESPSNPLLTVPDLPTICAADRKPGAIVAVDSTFATPLVQRPLDMGADVVMHSATKFIGGHSDLLAGVLVTRDGADTEDLLEDLADRRTHLGGTIGGLEAYLAIRGVRTLGLRMERAQANAMTLATRLETHDQVTKVRYPGLASHDTHAVAAGFMDGFGAIMSFDLTGPGERATAFCEAANLIHHATSLGGVESTMERRAVQAGQEHLPPTLIRLSVGCEHIEDLWSDLDQAMQTTRV